MLLTFFITYGIQLHLKLNLNQNRHHEKLFISTNRILRTRKHQLQCRSLFGYIKDKNSLKSITHLEISSDKSNLQLLARSIKALILSLGLMLFNSMVIEANTKCNHQVNHRNSKSNKISVNEYAKAR